MKRVGLFLLLLVTNYTYANNENQQVCSVVSELAKEIITKRIKENMSKTTAKLWMEYMQSSLEKNEDKELKKYWDENAFVTEHVSSIVDDAYQKKITHNTKKNNQIIKKFTKESYDDCMKRMLVYNKKKKAKIRELENKVAVLERENKEKSGQFYGINTDIKDGVLTHHILCKVGSFGIVVQSDNGEIFSYITKNGITHRNHKYEMTLDEASRLACK
ncbi:MAG: hypothetical protein CSA15_10435 [Candidatus Delongbacteria bacterium]|nr:MAG: hypothetical protein CSA15_10435 [Candidatus Delongbacteria bacterium]